MFDGRWDFHNSFAIVVAAFDVGEVLGFVGADGFVCRHGPGE